MADLYTKLLEDKNYLKKIASKYIELGSFKYVELDLHLDIGEIDDVFDEYHEISDEFDALLIELTTKKLRREGAHKIFKVIKTLYEAVESDTAEEDGGPTISDKIRASSALVKLIDSPKDRKKSEDGDFEKLMKQIENGE